MQNFEHARQTLTLNNSFGHSSFRCFLRALADLRSSKKKSNPGSSKEYFRAA